MICCDNLTFAYQKTREVLRKISFSAKKGERIGIIGPNGAGKSTLLRLLVGLESGYSGTLCIDTVPVDDKHIRQIRQNVGYVFQDSDNQLFMPTIRQDVAFAPQNYGLTESEVERRTEQALADTGITPLADRPAWQLSGGEKKLAAIATILSLLPQVILLDEPTGGLDMGNRRRLLRLLEQLPQTMLIPSHDLDMLYELCDRILLLDAGEIVADGTPEQLLTDSSLLERHGLELPLGFQTLHRSVRKCAASM